MWGLVEDKKSKEGWFLKVGDGFQGFVVSALSESELRLQGSEGTRTLAKSNRINIVPLKADANEDSQPSAPEASVSQAEAPSVIHLLATVRLTESGLSPKEIEHMKNEVFEGRMSLEAYNARIAEANQDTTTSIDLDSDVILSRAGYWAEGTMVTTDDNFSLSYTASGVEVLTQRLSPSDY